MTTRGALVISGIMRFILAFSMKEGAPWIWVVLSEVLSLLLGLVILTRWPVSILYVLELFVEVHLMIVGAGWIGIGLGLQKRA